MSCYSLDDSLGTPVKAPAATKISQIVDRNQKLNAYRLQKNTQKFKEIQEQKSPFIVTVPVGRWIEKKERFPQLRIGMNDTPVRNALMNERVLKKSTVKNLIAQSTAKKENVMIFGKSAVKPAIKSKKRILGELNAVHYIAEELLDDIPDLKPMDDELNTTFEISPEPKEPSKEPKVEEPIKRLRLSNSLPEIVHKVNFIPTKKMLTPPTKNGRTKEAIKKALVMKANPMSRAVVKKPVVARKAVPVKAAQVKTAPVREKPAPAQKKPATVHVKPTLARVVQAHVKPTRAQVEKVAPTKCIVNKVVKKNLPSLEITHDNTEPIEMIENPVALPVAETEPIKPIVKKKEPIRSQSYKLYKSSVDIQISYLTMQISELMNDQEIFLEILTEDQQTFVHQTAQQGNLLISDKLKRFEEFLDKFENDLSRPDDPKRVTEDDVDNYWYLIYDEIEKLKKDLSKIKDTKRNVLASQKKRRTRKTYVPADGTPKRSIRIAVNTGTPK